MARIVLVDDDFGSEILVEYLGYYGHEVKRLTSVDEALSSLEQIAAADLLILDIIMPRSSDLAEGGVSGSRNTGLVVFQRVRKIKPGLPILAYTATNDADAIALLKGDPYTTLIRKFLAPTMDEFVQRIERVLGLKHERKAPQPFIVHGHDEATKLQLKNYLQNSLNLPEPIILHEQPSQGKTLIEKFEHYAAASQLVFVLLTPDDTGAAAGAPDDEKRRARQNVIFELGFFLGALGRSSGKVFLLHKGTLELPSDLSGLVYIDISRGIEAAGEEIRRELANVIR